MNGAPVSSLEQLKAVLDECVRAAGERAALHTVAQLARARAAFREEALHRASPSSSAAAATAAVAASAAVASAAAAAVPKAGGSFSGGSFSSSQGELSQEAFGRLVHSLAKAEALLDEDMDGDDERSLEADGDELEVGVPAAADLAAVFALADTNQSGFLDEVGSRRTQAGHHPPTITCARMSAFDIS